MFNFSKFSFQPFVKVCLAYTLSLSPIILAINSGFFSAAYVEGRSMAPTLNHHLSEEKEKDNNRVVLDEHSSTDRTKEDNRGEVILIQKYKSVPQRGDVVVLDYPGFPGKQIVKRIIGKEGDVIVAVSKKTHQRKPTL